MGYDVFGDPVDAGAKNVPGWSQGKNLLDHGRDGDLGLIASDIADVGLTSVATWADPLGALVGAGVGFLIDFVKPLHDMLTWVTGDSDAISGLRKKWQDVGNELLKLADEMNQTLAADLSGWAGPASTVAKQRISEFIEGNRATAGEINNIAAVLDLSAALMEAAMSTLKDLISQFVEWLIVTWLAAQAAAIPSLGSSEAVAAAATTGEAAVATSRGARILQKVMAIFRKLRDVITKIMRRLGEFRNKSYWKLTGKGGNTALGPGGLGKGLVSNGKEARRVLRATGHRMPFGQMYDPVAPAEAAGNKIIVGGAGQAAQDHDSNVPSREELDNLLNPRRPAGPPPASIRPAD